MTRRKPAGMSWDAWIEQQIEEARRTGAFDQLPGRGRRDPDLKEVHDPAWWARKFVRREGVSILPPALELRRKVEKVLEGLPELRSEEDARRALTDLNVEIGRLNRTATTGPPTNMGILDVEAILAGWRKGRERLPS